MLFVFCFSAALAVGDLFLPIVRLVLAAPVQAFAPCADVYAFRAVLAGGVRVVYYPLLFLLPLVAFVSAVAAYVVLLTAVSLSA